MGVVVPLRPTPPKAKSAAERAVWTVWTPLEGRPVFSFDRWRAAEIIRLAASRKSPGLDWIEPLAAHISLLAGSLDPAPDEGEVRRATSRIVARLIPITRDVRERIECGVGQFRWRSYELGRALRLLPVERIALDLRTMRDISQTPMVMAAIRLARRRARDSEKRRAAGAETREVRATRRALVGALATTATISTATAYRWVKAAEENGVLDMSRVTECEISRHASDLLNMKQGRVNSHQVTPSALRKRKSRERAKAGAPNAPSAEVVPDRPVLASLPPEIAAGIVAAIASTLDLPTSSVSVDASRGCISISVRSPSAGSKVASTLGAPYSKARRRVEFYPEREAA